MLKYWMWLATRHGIGPRGIARLLEYFASPEEIYRADRIAWQQAGLDARACDALEDRSLDAANQIVLDCFNKNISILTMQDAAYPERLRNIDGAPPVLYYKGKVPKFDAEIAITVVGTRTASIYGMKSARQFGYQIASNGGLVISGMAKGIDTQALEGALLANRPAVAVLGSGVDVIYPKNKRSEELYYALIERGCVLSEFAPGTEPLARNFPIRNRILAGLALGVLVVEAPGKSGALITARYALDQGRDVYAVPSNLETEAGVGSNQLIQDGAALVTSGWEIVRNYRAQFPDKILDGRRPTSLKKAMEDFRRTHPAEPDLRVSSPAVPAYPSEKKSIDIPKRKTYIDVHEIREKVSGDEWNVLQALPERAISMDDLIERCDLPASRVLASVTMLEIKHYIKRYPGNLIELAGQP